MAKETQITTVTMDDGRVVEFAGKRKLLKTTHTSPEGRVQIRLDFLNGETRLFTVPDALISNFVAHGASQKLGDEIAGIESLDDAILAVDNLMDRLNNGVWAEKKESNGMAGTSVLLRALCEHTGKSRDDIRAFLDKKTHAEKVALRNNPKIKPIIERLEAEKAERSAPKVDTDALLGELEGGAAE